MQCPECNGFARVIDTRQCDHHTRRRRECDGCGCRFTTHETYVSGNDQSEPKPKQAPLSVFLKARRWGLSLSELAQAGRETGLERGAVLEAVNRAETRDEAMLALEGLGLTIINIGD